MTNNIKFGFFKNKFDAGSTSTVDSYPAYPEIPTAENFNTFISRGYVSQGGPVANVNTDFANILQTPAGTIDNDSIVTHSMPNGNVLIYGQYDYLSNVQPQVFIYDYQNANISEVTSPTQANLIFTDNHASALALDNNIYFYYRQGSGIINNNYARINKVNINTFEVDRADVWAGNISDPGGTQAITLVDGNILISPDLSNNTNFSLHVTQSITTDDHGMGGGNITFDDGYMVATPLVNDPSNSNDYFNMIQDPVTEIVYVIPGAGFKANSNVAEGKRSIGVYNPNSNTALRIEPANLDLSDSGPFADGDTLYQGVAYGLDKKFYAFPGQVKKDILVFDPATQDGVQNTFGIFNTVGSNTIICHPCPILATDGNIYARAYGSQESLGSNANAWFYVSIDTKPDSATYQQGSLYYINPANISYDPNWFSSSRSVAGDNLIISSAVPSGNTSLGFGIETLQISAPTGFNQVSRHPVLNQNNNVV